MYKLPYFTEEDQHKVMEFMKANSFAIITSAGGQFPVATHIPLELEKENDKFFLNGHLMKNTDHHKAFEKNENVLVIFNGPHSYVSASWYEDTKVASTWNYVAVHVQGKICFTDEEGTRNAIRSITNKYESPGSPASFDNLSEEYVEKLLKAIVGFRIEIVHIDNVFKLSQNHGHATREQIINRLQKSGDPESIAVSEEMKNVTSFK